MARRPALALLFASLTAHILGASTLVAYISPPGAMSSTVAGVTTEAFNSIVTPLSLNATYNSSIGVYSPNSGARIPIVAADQYGGASSSKYITAVRLKVEQNQLVAGIS
jgi:hypothetical protein